jgi:hypothetical protein
MRSDSGTLDAKRQVLRDDRGVQEIQSNEHLMKLRLRLSIRSMPWAMIGSDSQESLVKSLHQLIQSTGVVQTIVGNQIQLRGSEVFGKGHQTNGASTWNRVQMNTSRFHFMARRTHCFSGHWLKLLSLEALLVGHDIGTLMLVQSVIVSRLHSPSGSSELSQIRRVEHRNACQYHTESEGGDLEPKEVEPQMRDEGETTFE